MTRFHKTSAGNVPYTAEEETVRDIEEQAWVDGEDARELDAIREHRNHLLSETDWMANSDVTMTDSWKEYRQVLRDITNNNTVYEDVTWPTKP
tara:strand:- start:52 stop:330 length:279 start_codon:yes stop_codon:yes gene_type:complete